MTAAVVEPQDLAAAGREAHRLRQRVRTLDAEIGRLTAGADDTDVEDGAQPTDAQWLHQLLAADADTRLQMVRSLRRLGDNAFRCFVEDHDGNIERLTAAVAAKTAPETATRALALLEARDEIRTEARWQLMQSAADRPLDSIGRLEVLDKILTDRANLLRDKT